MKNFDKWLRAIACIIGGLLAYAVCNYGYTFITNLELSYQNREEQLIYDMFNYYEKKIYDVNIMRIGDQSIRTYAAPVDVIEKYLQNNNSNLLEYKDYIIEESLKYSIDPIFITALITLETGHGKEFIFTQQNNAGGIKCGQNFCSYNSKKEGIRATIRLVADYAAAMWEEPLSTIEDIYLRWSGSEGAVELLKQVYYEIERS